MPKPRKQTPTIWKSSLDIQNQYQVLQIVRDICHEQHLTAIVVIHDLNLALRFCDRFVLLRQGGVYACGVDAIQAILGCSIGKGNLLFHMRGKQAFSFYNRKTGKSVRLVLKAKPRDMTREETFDYYHSCADDEMFDVKETKIRLPEQARIFDSYVCDCCGETTGANWIRLSGDKKLCLDCYETYDRFDVWTFFGWPQIWPFTA